MRTKRVIHIADYAAEPVRGLAPQLAGARSFVTVPMLKDDSLIGVILIPSTPSMTPRKPMPPALSIEQSGAVS
jgi:hypothetical protein